MKKTTQANLGIVAGALIFGAPVASAEVENMIGYGIAGEISAGWDSQYFFRGLWFGDETAWTNIEFSKEFSSNLTGSVNLFYTEVMDEIDQVGGQHFAYSEGNIGANLSYDAGFGTFGLGYLHYRFYDGFAGSLDGVRAGGVGGNGDANEVSLSYSQELLWGIGFSALAAYDFRIDGSYAEIGFSKNWQFNDYVGLDFSVTTGYSIDDYYSASLGSEDDDFTHTLLSLALPIKLTETATLTPHVSANISHDARDATNTGVLRGDTEVYYGASFSVSF